MGKIRLRDDAQVLQWKNLSLSQKETLISILSTLNDACDSASDPVKAQRARILLIAGARGTGKTSTVLTAQACCEAQKDQPARGAASEQREQKFNELVQECGKDLVWLPALNMDPLPPSTNLVGAILARVNDSVTARRLGPGTRRGYAGRLDGGTGEDQLLNSFATLQNEAIRAFEGNLDARKPHLDPEVFAVEAASNERIKVDFRDKLNNQLGHMAGLTAADTKRTVFVLPIDDFDTSPLRAVELMKLLHSIAVPRLFTIFMGSIDIADKMLYYDIQHQFTMLLGSMESADPEARKDIASAANEIASTSLRKILPPTQRLELSPMQIREALKFDPGSLREKPEPSRSLDDLLKAMRFRMSGLPQATGSPSPHRLLGCPIDSLRDLLLISDKSLTAATVPERSDGQNTRGKTSEGTGEKKDTFLYEASEILRAPARQLADLWHMLSSVLEVDTGREQASDRGHTGEINDKDKSRLVTAVVETLRNLIDEDPLLDVLAQRILKTAILRNEADSQWELHPAQLDAISHFGDELQLTLDSAGALPDSVSQWKPFHRRVSARRIRDVRIRVTRPATEPIELSPRTRAVWMLLHDLILLTERGVVAGTLRYSTLSERAYGLWDDGVSEALRVPWFLERAQWATFWQGDIANHVWNRGEVLARMVLRERATLNDDGVTLILAYSWIAAGVAALSPDSQEAEVLAFLQPPDKVGPQELWTWENLRLADWRKLLDAVIAIAKIANDRHREQQDDRYTSQIHDWLVGLACLLGPETAIPWDRMPGSAASATPPSTTNAESGASLDTATRQRRSTFGRLIDDPECQEAWHRIQDDIRRSRLDRLGKHVATRLGITLLNPGLVPDEKGLDDRWHALKGAIESVGYDKRFWPTRREITSRVERVREQHRNARHAAMGGPLSEEQRNALLHWPELQRAARWLGLEDIPDEPAA